MAAIIEKVWITKSGLTAMSVIIDNGKYGKHRCGYVAVPSGHALHGKGYSENVPALADAARNAKMGKKSPILVFTASVDATEGEQVRWSADVAIDVHGGITFSGEHEGMSVSGTWWFGFDCSHYNDARWDVQDQSIAFCEGVVRTFEYVEAECERMAEQLAAIK